jgi:hypothetical protein
MHVTTLGIDLAKHVFQLHGVDDRGQVVLSMSRPTRMIVEMPKQSAKL